MYILIYYQKARSTVGPNPSFEKFQFISKTVEIPTPKPYIFYTDIKRQFQWPFPVSAQPPYFLVFHILKMDQILTPKQDIQSAKRYAPPWF